MRVSFAEQNAARQFGLMLAPKLAAVRQARAGHPRVMLSREQFDLLRLCWRFCRCRRDDERNR